MTAGEKLDSGVVGAVHKGQSKEEVRRLFGQPKRTESGSTGNTLDVFVVVLPHAGTHTGAKADIRSLHVLYNGEGLVEKSTYYVGESRAAGTRFTQQWQAGAPLSADKVEQIQRGKTTRDELVKMFGLATIEGLDVYGNKTMSWVFVQGRNTTPSAGRELVVRLDQKSVARDYLMRDLRP